MTYLIAIEQEVGDFELWQQEFKTHWQEKHPPDIEVQQLTQGMRHDHSELMLTLRTNSLESAESFVASNELQDLLHAPGMLAPPHIHIGELVPSEGRTPLEFDQEELEELCAMVETQLRELWVGIHHATLSSFRDGLKERRKNLRALHNKIRRHLGQDG